MDDKAWLERAVAAAAQNVLDGGGPFGALVVKGDELISVGVNRVTPTLDPTAHAEVVAIRDACQKLQTFKLDGCLLVASCEPCPLCLSAALWARMDRVIFAADRHDAAEAGFDDRAFYEVFTTPVEQWPVQVQHLGGPGATLPFQHWNDKADKVEY
ncbi:nucleoside deaminase [Spongisporangium articulatum]|uniref:Nucleoside deaminase n=1 Tax=Spongisporangium articulatum TaxID=3362603 RepID=A0ABW8AHD1_9ACTN